MAVLQRQYPRPLQRPAARPVPTIKLPVHRTRSRAFMRAAERARQASLIACAAGASILVLYIAGHARMAAVNYQRVKIFAQVRDLRAANDRLHSEIIGASGKASVAAWAKAHGMVLESRDPFTLSR